MQSDTERRMPLTPSRISWRGPFFPSILHQDLGYYQLPHGGFLKRAGHVWAEFSSHAPIPATQLTYSELVGGVSAAAISAYTYHPDSERSARNVIWGTQMAWDAVTYMIKEFWPDLRKKSRKSSH